jgi:hypothetical protein
LIEKKREYKVERQQKCRKTTRKNKTFIKRL